MSNNSYLYEDLGHNRNHKRNSHKNEALRNSFLRK